MTAPVTIRPATPADNPALIALAAACPMEGEIALRVDRAPDFFALNRLEGERWEVAVADAPWGGLAGCVALSSRRAYLGGAPADTFYTGDLKVHPTGRGSAAADALELWVRDTAAAEDAELPILLTILAGNASMERRMAGPRGLPRLDRFATIRSYAIPLLHRRREPAGDMRVHTADERDLEEMAALWTAVAPGRQLAPVLDAAGLAAWIARAPGLALEDYLIARDRDGRVAGFVAFWDQTPLKALRVTGYSRRLGVVRVGLSLAARAVGAAPIPRVGEPLTCRTAVNVCVPADRPDVLRALVLHAYDRWRGVNGPRRGGTPGGRRGAAASLPGAMTAGGASVLLVGLDRRDPLAVGLGGLLAQPTDIHACVTSGRGRYGGPRLDDRPLHYEIALV